MHPPGRHLFIGGRDRGLAWLQRLVGRRQPPLAVYCLDEDEHEVERHAPAIGRFCSEHGIPCQTRRRLLPADEVAIAELAPDLITCMGWRTLISGRVLSIPRLGSVAVHESLLPAYRGFAPVNWAVINGESRTGVTLFFLTATGVDNGDIIGQAVVPVAEADSADDVYRRTAQASLRLLDEHFDALLSGKAPRRPQDERLATYTCARTPDDGLIYWSSPTQAIHNLVRGLAHPYPGAFTYYGAKRYRIWRGEVVKSPRPFIGRIPGRVVGFSPGSGVEVLTGDGIYIVQTAGEDGQPPAPAGSLFRSVRASFRDYKA